jgi:hypothetical protein
MHLNINTLHSCESFIRINRLVNNHYGWLITIPSFNNRHFVMTHMPSFKQVFASTLKFYFLITQIWLIQISWTCALIPTTNKFNLIIKQWFEESLLNQYAEFLSAHISWNNIPFVHDHPWSYMSILNIQVYCPSDRGSRDENIVNPSSTKCDLYTHMWTCYNS